jgi:hypothetical protein
LKATEEVRLTRQRTTRRVPERITLRREEALIERVDAAAETGKGVRDSLKKD